MSNLVKVDFYGDELQAVQDADSVHVFITPICDRLGLAPAMQAKRLRSAEWATPIVAIGVGADGRRREMLAVSIDDLLMWLATIDANRVAKAVRPSLVRYQRECGPALRRHFMPSAPAAPAPQIHVDPVIESGARMGDTVEGRAEVRRRCEIAARACKLPLLTVLGFVRRQSRCSSPYFVGDMTWRFKVLPMLDGLAMGHFFLAGPKPRKPKPRDPRQSDLFGEN